MVAVVRAPDADSGCQEIATRIIAELMATRVPVIALTCPAADAACVPTPGGEISAVVSIQLRDGLRAVEVRAGETFGTRHDSAWVVAGGAGRPRPGGAPAKAGDAEVVGGAAALAVRTVELLRAMSIELADYERRAPTSAVPPPAGPPVAAVEAGAGPRDAKDATAEATSSNADLKEDDDRPRVPIGPHNITLSIGGLVLGGGSQLGAAYGPALRVGRHAFDHFLFSLLVAGPTFGQTLQNGTGTVSVRQELAQVEADVVGAFSRLWTLRLGVGGGIYHIHAEGRIPTFVPTTDVFVPGPNLTRAVGGTSGLLSWSAGAVANLRQDVGLFVDARVIVLAPAQAVLLEGVELGRAGNPALSLTMGVEMRL